MKKFLTMVALLFLSMTASAQYYKVIVKLKDKTSDEYLYKDVDCIKWVQDDYEWVDLGVSVKWATCNIGASSPVDYGDYFAWGETETYYSDLEPLTWKKGKEYGYLWYSYKYYSAEDKVLTKYVAPNGHFGVTDHRTVLEPEDDAAHVNWGGDWRMPSVAEFEELNIENCTWTWYESGNQEFSGVAGYKVTSKIPGFEGNSIFFPACGIITTDLSGNDYSPMWLGKGTNGMYLSNSIRDEMSTDARDLGFSSLMVVINTVDRCDGASVRPVYDPKPNRYEYVDLGLSVKWAKHNVGATKPEEYGDFFAWGETKPYYSCWDPLTWRDGKDKGYGWSSYSFCKGGNNTMTRYCTNGQYGTVDDKTVLEPGHDAAFANWGGKWRMPTKEEMQELVDKCTWTWYKSDNQEFNGVAGYKVTSNMSGYEDKYIFLPAAGGVGTIHALDGMLGLYWSSSLFSAVPSASCCFLMMENSLSVDRSDRYSGYSVRPVCK